jgi:hypothetical protein
VDLINLLSSKNLEIQLSLDLIKVEDNVVKAADSAGVFESIRGVNQEVKQAMREELKRRGLTEDEIRYVFHIDKD